MVDFHTKTFFGQDSALIVQSSTRKDPSTFFKFFQKKQDGSWERPSEGEGLTAKFAMRELVFLLRVLSRETEDWTAMHQFQDKTTNFHLIIRPFFCKYLTISRIPIPFIKLKISC